MVLWTRLLVVYCFAGLSASVLLAHAGKDEAAVTEETMTEDQRRVHQECRNPDYKQYVKCLMRPKRHHHMDRGDMPSEQTDALCLETCLSKCHLEHDCDKKCSHCTKRIRYKHQFITEYEKECDSSTDKENCPYPVKPTNITTNIDIKNFINLDNHTTFPPTDWRPFPLLPIVPQISLVPQITYGMGYGATGGCAYNQWLCIQQTGVQIPKRPNCSGCGSPVLRDACDVSCYTIQTNTTIKEVSCKSPACVGGSPN